MWISSFGSFNSTRCIRNRWENSKGSKIRVPVAIPRGGLRTFENVKDYVVKYLVKSPSHPVGLEQEVKEAGLEATLTVEQSPSHTVGLER